MMSDWQNRFLALSAYLLLAASAIGADPAIEATLALPRTEPRHYVEAVLVLSDLGATAESEEIAAEFGQLSLSEEQMVALVDAVGTARITRMGRVAPTTAATVQQILDAAHAAATSPDRLATLVERLAGNREQAVEAIRMLRHTGTSGVTYCLGQIAKSQDPQVRARLREALVALDPISRPAVFTATGSKNEQIAEQAAYALGRLGEMHRLRTPIAGALVAGNAFKQGPAGNAARWATQAITGTIPTLPKAKTMLSSAVKELLSGAVLFDESSSQENDFAVQLAARLSQDLADLDPSDHQAAQNALVLGLETGAEVSADSLATYELSAALGRAINLSLHQAAQRCCEALGERGDASALAGQSGTTSALAQALESGHPAVRFAAVEAILAIGPTTPFPGASRVAPTLLYFATATGDDIAVVAYPQLAKAGATAGWLLGNGYAATPTNRGSDALRIATESPDTQLVLIDMSISLPGARETLFRLRRSPTTALTPVIVLASDGRLSEAERLADEHGHVIASSRPHNAEATTSLARQALADAVGGLPASETRTANAEKARTAIAKIVADGPAFYGMSAHADRVIALTATTGEASLTTLSELGTPESQQRLLDAASLEARSLAARKAAADAFAQTVRKHGILLSTEPIRRQYDRYNLSATAPAETQELLGRLLDILEGEAK